MCNIRTYSTYQLGMIYLIIYEKVPTYIYYNLYNILLLPEE